MIGVGWAGDVLVGLADAGGPDGTAVADGEGDVLGIGVPVASGA